MKKILNSLVKVSLVLTTVFLTLNFFLINSKIKAMELPKITYQAHVEDYGWLGIVYDGEVAGTVGQDKQLESMILNLEESGNSMVRYCAHVPDVGW